MSLKNIKKAKHVRKENPASNLQGRVFVNIAVRPDLAYDFDQVCDSVNLTRCEVIRMLMIYACDAKDSKGKSIILDVIKSYNDSLVGED